MFRSHTMRPQGGNKGFTLIEVIISIAIFIIVMTVSAGALLSIVNGNKKAKTSKAVMDNLSFALENISRNARVGTDYSCSVSASGGVCPGGSTQFSHIDSYDTNPTKRRIGYEFTGGRLYQNIYRSGVLESSLPITAPNVNISSGTFFYTKASASQPRLVIALKGTAGAKAYRTDFSLQTSITQRLSN